MESRLSVEGLWAQARRVIAGRGLALAVVALLWGVATWFVERRPTAPAMSDIVGGDDGSQWIVTLLPEALGLVGTAVMLGVVARTGLPRRSVVAVVAHAALAAVTVLAVGVVYGGGIWLSKLVAYAMGEGENWQSYLLIFLPMLLQVVVFAYLGMTLPAALERPIGPFKAVSVALRLSRDRRIWLGLMALVWITAMTVPVHGLQLFGALYPDLIFLSALLGAMLTTFGMGVLYLELRRLHTARAAASDADVTA